MSAALLARLAKGPLDVNERSLDDATTTAVLGLLDGGYITSTVPYVGMVTYTITEEGQRQVRRFTSAAIAGAAGNHEHNIGEVALWAWLLLNGGEIGPHDDQPMLKPTTTWHLLVCGLDLDRSGSVRDDVWTVWGGTFGADERQAGVSGSATCKCGQVADLELNATVESVTDLLRQTLALA